MCKGFKAQKKEDYTGRDGGIESLIHFFIESLGRALIHSLIAPSTVREVRWEAAKIANSSFASVSNPSIRA